MWCEVWRYMQREGSGGEQCMSAGVLGMSEGVLGMSEGVLGIKDKGARAMTTFTEEGRSRAAGVGVTRGDKAVVRVQVRLHAVVPATRRWSNSIRHTFSRTKSSHTLVPGSRCRHRQREVPVHTGTLGGCRVLDRETGAHTVMGWDGMGGRGDSQFYCDEDVGQGY